MRAFVGNLNEGEMCTTVWKSRLLRKVRRKMKEKIEKSRGITLVVLVVTIIIMLILIGITLSVLNGSSLFGKADEASYKTRMAGYKEQVDLYVTNEMLNKVENDKENINSGEPLKEVIEAYRKEGEEFDITEEEVNIPIKEIITNIEKKDEKYIVVYHGETYYVKSDKNKNAEKEAQWCLDVGIKILELKRPSGMDNTKGSYEFVNGVYMNTPELGTGFNPNTTRYANETDKGTMTPGKWIFEKPDANWYDYKNSKWANLVVENNGAETYFTWIPRYCFKLDQNGQRSDVKLISVENYWKDPYADDENNNTTEWEELEAQGYQIPDAFTFDGKELPGFWAMKYNIGETPTPSIVDYDMITKSGTITIKNTTITNPAGEIEKCVIYLNGKEKYTITNKKEIEEINSKEYKLTGLRKGDNVINITLLNAQEEMIGSRTRVYAMADVNEPDLSGFESIKDTTFYVTYDENGNEHSTIPISNEAPEIWYNYSEAEWANIVVRNNGGEIYYTWIPRYEFTLNQTDQRSVIKFIKGNSTSTTSGYQIPDAFTFDGKELTGFWAMKYNIGDVNTTLFDTSIVTSGTTITTQGVKGSSVQTGQTYTYYINGKKDGNTTENATEGHVFRNLKPNTIYTILIEIRDKATDALLGTIVKQGETSQPNKPELKGFNPECTYYVTYDESGNETIGEKIKNDGSNMPNNWYDYGRARWANIVVKGKTTDGKETSTYFTWIPRYKFKLDQQTQRSNVKFIEGTEDGDTTEYKVPEAFTFDGKQLTGFWSMKYNIGDQ